MGEEKDWTLLRGAMKLTISEILKLEAWLTTQPDWRDLTLRLDKQAGGDGVIAFELLAAVRKARE